MSQPIVTIDSTFPINAPNLGNTSTQPVVAVDGDGNIVIAYNYNATPGVPSNAWVALQKLDQAGNVLATYSSNTKPAVVGSMLVRVLDIAIQADGKPVVCMMYGSARQIAIGRWLANLSDVDVGFGSGGVYLAPSSTVLQTLGEYSRIAIGTNNRIYYTAYDSTNAYPLVNSISATGTAVNTGTVPPFSIGSWQAIALRRDGTVVVAGRGLDGTLRLGLYSAACVFTQQANLTTNTGTPTVTNINITRNNQIMVAFGTDFGATSGFRLVRYNSDLTLDNTWPNSTNYFPTALPTNLIAFSDDTFVMTGYAAGSDPAFPSVAIGVAADGTISNPTGFTQNPYSITFWHGCCVIPGAQNGKALCVGFMSAANTLGISRLNTTKGILQTGIDPPGMVPFNQPFQFTGSAENLSSVWFFVDNSLGLTQGSSFTNGDTNGWTFTTTFTTPGAHSLTVESRYTNSGSNSRASIQFDVPICLHGDSVVALYPEGSGHRLLKEIRAGDLVVGPDGGRAEVKALARCWRNGDEKENPPRCVVFDVGSIASGVPTERFVVDVGHPIGVRGGDTELISAGEFAKRVQDRYGADPSGIRVMRWDEAEEYLPGAWWRYDLVLEDGRDAYMANGVVVKSRSSNWLDAGYEHDPEEFGHE